MTSKAGELPCFSHFLGSCIAATCIEALRKRRGPFIHKLVLLCTCSRALCFYAIQNWLPSREISSAHAQRYSAWVARILEHKSQPHVSIRLPTSTGLVKYLFGSKCLSRCFIVKAESMNIVQHSLESCPWYFERAVRLFSRILCFATAFHMIVSLLTGRF